ncbi:uncharacterized protein LOC132205802 [Neocloeon triangulifer]|uniref:uncharacterized protein LOC132205802 n=1 Tax=Neocloeon triangulifer TaxID=2078957 RepID=UPI00286F754B|nr:uncharacterized protein LOC132205802 [Neocloeon triangulifer]
MTSIRQTTTTTYTTSSAAHPSLLDNGSPMDGSLDLLLEDLQSSVSRPGSSLGNSLTNGHVTTTTTTKRQHYGHSQQQPPQQQHAGGIQYLQPMNSTTVVSERASSPHTLSSYKTYQYQYHSSSGSAPQDGGHQHSSQQYQYQQRSPSPQREVPDTRLRQNLNELDSLLVDLHHAQQSTPLEPNELTSAQHVSRVVRTFQQQQQVDNHTYGTPNTIRRELQYPPSPKLERSSSLSRRAPAPGGSVLRAPSPTRQVTTTVKTYTYEIPADHSAHVKPVVSTPIVNTYSYEIPIDQPKPDDTVITYKYAGLPKPRALEAPKEPPLLVDRPPNSYSLHYTSTMQGEPPHRPFPSPAMTPPPSAEPPKRLEELLASFSDTVDTSDMHNENPVPAAPLKEYMTNELPLAPPSPIRQRKIEPEKPPVVQLSKNISGPPVYYPPGVEMFAKKDEPIHAKMKEGASSKDDGKSSGGGVAAVPVCLPVCCAMPCVIM